MRSRMKLIDVKDRLPSQKNLDKDMLFVFHENTPDPDERMIEGRVGYFNPQDNRWSVLDIEAQKEGQTRLKDVTEWVNYWTAVPRNSRGIKRAFRFALNHLKKAEEEDDG